MPCNLSEVEMNDSIVGPKLCTPKNALRKARARDNSDGEVTEPESDSVDFFDAVPERTSTITMVIFIGSHKWSGLLVSLLF